MATFQRILLHHILIMSPLDLFLLLVLKRSCAIIYIFHLLFHIVAGQASRPSSESTDIGKGG
jgi:hypothetical protein